MKISVRDGSNYFKGLLLLIRKDLRIAESEIHLMKRIGKSLGFEEKFCDNAIHDILDNTFILDEFPEFSAKDIAIKFIKDGFTLAFSDKEIHPSEDEWLRSIAEKNGLDRDWFHRERENARERKGFPARLEVDDLVME